ncbi:MAG: glycosyltransferase family 9 protein [Cytophagales bacterium]|nr:glycosyltransferase family 9 protein [Cytophagales bacterium]
MNSLESSAHDQYNQGLAFYEQLRYGDALACFIRAREIEPDYLDAHWNECLMRLILGDFKEGWALHEARWQKNEGRWEPDPTKRGWHRIAQPLWVGDFSIEGKTICLWGEQGFGDMLQFCRYAAAVQARGAQVFLYVRESLVRLLRQSFAGVGIDVVGNNEPLPPFDFHCPMMSLPLACGTDSVEKIPASTPYLFANEQDTEQWRKRLLQASPLATQKIGLVWSGLSRITNPYAIQMDQERSIDLDFFAPLLTQEPQGDPRTQWISLQKGGVLPAHFGVLDLTQDLQDWADTAALIANLDLVISCDTAVAHLAASMNKPTWILSRWSGCWRWMGHRIDSPWYPSVRLFHQPARGDWASVISQVQMALGVHSQDVHSQEALLQNGNQGQH